MSRDCKCEVTRDLPLCACHEGLWGKGLEQRSAWLSSLAGWPGRLDPAVVAEHEARAGESKRKAKEEVREARTPEWLVEAQRASLAGEPVVGPPAQLGPLKVGEAAGGCSGCGG